jgi:hypothetical protein
LKRRYLPSKRRYFPSKKRFFLGDFCHFSGNWMLPCPATLRSLALLQNCFNSTNLTIRWTSTIGTNRNDSAWFSSFATKRFEDSQETDSNRSRKFAARQKAIDFAHTPFV